MNAYVIVLRLTCDSPKIALKLTMGAWKPANTNPSDKMYVCMLDVAVQRANSMVSFYDSFQKYKLRHWLKNAQRAVINFIDYSKCLLQPIITISFVNVKLTFKFLPNTMSVFHSVNSVWAVQGISHWKKVIPQTLPNKLSLVVKNYLCH